MERLDFMDEQTRVLIADVIHKIKNSLGGVTGFAALLERDTGAKDPKRKHVRKIQEQALKLNDWVLRLWDLVGEPELESGDFFIAPVLTQACGAGAREKAADAAGIIDPGIARSRIRVQGDEEQFNKMMIHAMNALRFMKANLETIREAAAPSGRIALDMVFAVPPDSRPAWDLLQEGFERLQPLEARLSLALLSRLASRNGIEVFLDPPEGGRGVMRLHIPKGKA
jgi:signal transduction histidine kinase